MDEVHLFVYRLVSRRMQAASGGHVKRAAAGAIYFMMKINNALAFTLGWLKHHCTRAVAEKNAGCAVGVIQN